MPKGFRTDINWAQIAHEVDHLPHGSKSGFVSGLAEQLGVSTATIRRRIQKFSRKQIKHSRKRDSKYTPDLVDLALEQQELYKRILLRGTNRALSTQQLIEIMEEMGEIEPGYWSVSGLNKAIRLSGYRDLKPRLRVEATHYCQQFQIDFSRSKHFQVVDRTEDGQWVLLVSAKELHYKEGAERLRLWVTQVVDEFSRLRLVRYNAATGESSLLGMTFMDWYFNRPDDGHFLRHKPEAIRGDHGAFMLSNMAMNAFDAMGIRHGMSGHENKETQGKVERGFGVLWGKHESRLAFELSRDLGLKPTITLGELNEWLNNRMISEQSMSHPVETSLTRLQMAQRSALQSRPTKIEKGTDVLGTAFKTWERKADVTCMVSVGGVKLEVPDKFAGKTIRVHMNLHGEYVGQPVDGYSARPFPLVPYEYATLGKFDKKRAKVYSEVIRDRVIEKQKVRTLAPKSKVEKPDTVFTQAEEAAAKPKVELDRKLKLAQARHEYAQELAYRCHLDDPGAAIPQIVMFAVEDGSLYNDITKREIKQLAQDVADAIDAQQRRTGS